MSDFLRHLAARTLGLVDGVRPRVASLFAPGAVDALPDEAGGTPGESGAHGGWTRDAAHDRQRGAHEDGEALDPPTAARPASALAWTGVERGALGAHDAAAQARGGDRPRDMYEGRNTRSMYDGHDGHSGHGGALPPADARADLRRATPWDAGSGDGLPATLNRDAAQAGASQTRRASGAARPPALAGLTAASRLSAHGPDGPAATALAPGARPGSPPPDARGWDAALAAWAAAIAGTGGTADMERTARDGSIRARAGPLRPEPDGIEARRRASGPAGADAQHHGRQARHLSDGHPILSRVPTMGKATNGAASGAPYGANRRLSRSDPGTTVNVTIGRVDVRAITSPAPAPAAATRPAERAPSALERYLHRRKGSDGP